MTESNLISDLKSQNKIIDECYRFLEMKMRSAVDKKEEYRKYGLSLGLLSLLKSINDDVLRDIDILRNVEE